MTEIAKIMINSTVGKYQINMPDGGLYQYFDFFNDSPYQVAVVFGQDTGASSTDIIMLPNTIEEMVPPPANNSLSINGLWARGALFVYVSLPAGGNVSASQAPAQELTILGHSQGFRYGKLTTLSRFQGVSNPSLNTNGGNVASSIVNDGQIPTSPVIEASPLGDTQSTVKLDNLGNMVLGDAMHPGSLSVGNGTFAVDGSGNTDVNDIDVAGALKVLNTTGMYRVLAALNQFTNNNTLFMNIDNGRLDVNDENGNFMGGWTDAGSFSIADVLDIFQTPASIPGTTAGTVFVYTPIVGNGLIVTVIHVTNYNNTTAPQQVFNLPLYHSAVFYVGAITNPTTSGCFFRLNGTGVVTNAAKMGSANVNGVGRVQCFSIGEVMASFNQVVFDGTLTGTSSGTIIIIGA